MYVCMYIIGFLCFRYISLMQLRVGQPNSSNSFLHICTMLTYDLNAQIVLQVLNMLSRSIRYFYCPFIIENITYILQQIWLVYCCAAYYLNNICTLCLHLTCNWIKMLQKLKKMLSRSKSISCHFGLFPLKMTFMRTHGCHDNAIWYEKQASHDCNLQNPL